MVRERRRLLISPERLLAAPAEAGLTQLQLDPEESHYVARVLRLRPGMELAIVNGRGQLWGASIGDGEGRRCTLTLLQPLQAPEAEASAPTPSLTLAIALPKRDSDLLLRMACELGVDRLQPLIADHSVLAERFNRPRLEAILREATEQCERLWLPQLADPRPSRDWFAAGTPGVKLLATTRQGPLPDPLTALRAQPRAASEALQLAIGPEGGWSASEEAAASAAGWQAVGLNAAILRTSTAAVAGVTLLSHWREQGDVTSACCSIPDPIRP